MTRRLAGLLASALLLGSVEPAASATPGSPPAPERACPPAGGPWLRVELQGDAVTAPLRARVLQQMAADLGSHGIAVCAAQAEGAPLADVQVALARPATLSIDLHDDVTQKRVTRTLSLAGVPGDARGLSVALAVEELLHASWIEAALAPAASPERDASTASATSVALDPVPRPVPAAVVATNDAEITLLPRAPSTFAALVGAIDHATGGQTAIGGDLRLAWGGRATLGLRVGARASPDTASPHGSIRQQELLAGVSGAWAFWPPPAASVVPRAAPFGAELVVRVDAVQLQLSGVAAPGAVASNGSALGVLASGGVGVFLGLGGALRLVAEVTAGAPLRGVSASDTGQTATGLTGFALGGALGLGAAL